MRYVLLDDLPHQARAIIRLTGPDTRRFVQGTITADIESAATDSAVAGALCTVKGKLVSELVVLADGGDTVELLVPADVASDVAEALERHVIMDDVVVSAPAATSIAVLWDPSSDAPPPRLDAPQVRTYAAQHPGVGRLVFGPREAVVGALAQATATDAEGWAARRIHTATPAWRQEIEPDTFPPEVGFVAAVSYDKGCFMGQEPLARIHARGQVNRVMVRIKADARPAGAWEPLLDDAEAKMGRVTTWAPDGEGAIGLAIVRRAAASVGTVLHAGGLAITVVSGPLGDDVGVGTKKRTATVKLGRR